MSDIILKVENVSKQYQLGTFGTKTIGGDVHRWWTTKVLGKEDPFLKVGEVNDRTSKEKADFVWALKDINFEVKRGEVLGIIGKNGAGKSTLLKLLSRVTSPTIGTIKSAGRMASLLEVGTGFHPELTGLENIYLNGAILGMTKSEIKRKLEEIIDFSGCALYIDTPVKRYSSGMKVRLGFAVAAFLDPEILVVDEVLAVGDAEFQKRAIGKMKEVSSAEGRTILFVSHNLDAIKNLCPQAILMANGEIQSIGETSIVIDQYLDKNRQKSLTTNCFDFSVGQNKLVSLSITNSKGEHVDVINKSTKTEYFIEIIVNVGEPVRGLDIGVIFKNSLDQTIFTTTFKDNQIDTYTSRFWPVGLYRLNVELPKFLRKGGHVIDAALTIPKFHVYDIKQSCLFFEVIDEFDVEVLTGEGRKNDLISPHINWTLNDKI